MSSLFFSDNNSCVIISSLIKCVSVDITNDFFEFLVKICKNVSPFLVL